MKKALITPIRFVTGQALRLPLSHYAHSSLRDRQGKTASSAGLVPLTLAEAIIFSQSIIIKDNQHEQG
ncbi:hypothetical protein KJ688_04525 [bacterium]|nr:hypothetical protein [bacterium]